MLHILKEPKSKWWVVKSFDVGRELGHPDYVIWATNRIEELESKGNSPVTQENIDNLRRTLTRMRGCLTPGKASDSTMIDLVNHMDTLIQQIEKT